MLLPCLVQKRLGGGGAVRGYERGECEWPNRTLCNSVAYKITQIRRLALIAMPNQKTHVLRIQTDSNNRVRGNQMLGNVMVARENCIENI